MGRTELLGNVRAHNSLELHEAAGKFTSGCRSVVCFSAEFQYQWDHIKSERFDRLVMEFVGDWRKSGKKYGGMSSANDAAVMVFMKKVRVSMQKEIQNLKNCQQNFGMNAAVRAKNLITGAEPLLRLVNAHSRSI